MGMNIKMVGSTITVATGRHCSSLEDVPEEMLRTIADFLGKRDQYKLFSLCVGFKPFLYEYRTFNLRFCYQEYPPNKYTSEKVRYNPNPYLWQWFATSEEHHEKFRSLAGIADSSTSAACRKCQLAIDYEDLVSHATTLLIPYIHYFSEITISYYDCNNLVEAVDLAPLSLSNPTAAIVNRYLQSRWIPLNTEGGTLQNAIGAIGQFLQLPADTEPTLQALWGVHRLYWNCGHDSLFVEMAPDANAKLHNVTIDSCEKLLDLTCLQAIPEVTLIRCDHISDVSALSAANRVEIVSCRSVRDLSALAHVETLILVGLKLNDLSALGSVKKLTLKNCKKVTVFPVPTVGKVQQWEVNNVDVVDVSGWGNLEKLTLTSCPLLQDISMLGHVQSLTIGNCNRIQLCDFPAPLGRLQEWTLVGFERDTIECNKFDGVHKLTLSNCSTSRISGIKHIHTLNVAYCFTETLEMSDMSVTELLIEDCSGKLMLKNRVIVQELTLSLTDLLSTNFGPKTWTILQRLVLISNAYEKVVILNLAYEELVPMTTIAFDAYYYTYLVHPTKKAKNRGKCGMNFLQPVILLDNFRLRAAVDMWCINRARARSTYGDMSSWNVSQVTDMSFLFYEKDLNCNISSWDVRKVTNMSDMFNEASSFNQPLDSWDVSNVTNMNGMFWEASSFDQSLNSWNVNNVTDMRNMFCGATLFDQQLDCWTISKECKINQMFSDDSLFNLVGLNSDTR